MSKLRFAIFGTGFWSRFQLAAWRELEGAECVALFNRTRARAEALAKEFGVAAVYDDAAKLLANEKTDFVDIITDVGTHAEFVALAARHRLPVICQKPMGRTLAEARGMVDVCRRAGVPFFVHENWRWQAPIRAFKEVLASGRLGRIIRGRIDYAHSFPVFDNQPFLKELDQFILTDIGTHILDVARFLWGEAGTLYCQTRRIHPDIKGEDVATVMMRMTDGVTVTANMSYASRWEFDLFPETFLYVEGSEGGASLGADCTLRVFTKAGAEERRVEPKHYAWADPAYALIHSSIVECNRNLFSALRGEGTAETTGADNLKTLELVFAAYDSAASGKAITFR
ncbi:MAG TPA: gfo/Idh/MocA family oxidoreductase [Verrucomicrobiales bacterium]|nr:gfo/Idh/MocA family oxidoreductase [Verrucomicrobiales bacterium]